MDWLPAVTAIAVLLVGMVFQWLMFRANLKREARHGILVELRDTVSKLMAGCSHAQAMANDLHAEYVRIGGESAVKFLLDVPLEDILSDVHEQVVLDSLQRDLWDKRQAFTKLIFQNSEIKEKATFLARSSLLTDKRISSQTVDAFCETLDRLDPRVEADETFLLQKRDLAESSLRLMAEIETNYLRSGGHWK